jgi:hypothetical protein
MLPSVLPRDATVLHLLILAVSVFGSANVLASI